jgi:long-chain acyl-CoA synthetase
LINLPQALNLIQSEIDRLNEGFGNYEKVKKFELLAIEWSVAGGELTPKLSLKRRVILDKYSAQIEKIYQE